MRWHRLLRHRLRRPLLGLLRRIVLVAGLRLLVRLLRRVGLPLRLGRVRSALIRLRIGGLQRVAARTPGRRRRHAGLAGGHTRLTGRWPLLRSARGRLRSKLAGCGSWLPGGWIGSVHRRDRPLLIWRDIRSGGALERRLAAPEQFQQAPLVNVEVPGQAGSGAGSELELAAMEFPEEIEGVACPTDTAAAGVRQGPGLKAIHKAPPRLAELQRTRLAAVDHLVQEAEQADAIDRAERGSLGLGARLPLALGEELHTAVTGDGRLSLPV